MTTYHVGIARREGNVDGWVMELPGCRAIGNNVEDVNALMPVVTAEYIGWLRSWGEDVADASSFEVVEDLDNVLDYAFDAEKAPLSDADFEKWLRWMSYAQADFQAIVSPLAEPVMTWKPPASAVRIDATFPDVRSIAEMIDHVRRVEPGAYVGAVTSAPGTVTRFLDPEDLPAVADIHRWSEAALRSLGPEVRSQFIERPLRAGGIGVWSVRKVIRRAIGHKRFHTREIEQRLCWLTLGVPEILPVSRE